MTRQPDRMDRADVESLLAMSQVHLASSAGKAGAAAVDSPRPASPSQAAASRALTDAQRARELFGQQNVVGATRFTLPKRLLLRVSRIFTHRLVGAGIALADAADTLARAQIEAGDEAVRAREQALDDIERMGNSVRALVVSVEIASQDALDSLASSLLDSNQVPASATASAVSSFESTVTLLEGRLASLERDREQDQREIERLKALVSRPAVVSSPVGEIAPPSLSQSLVVADEPVLDDATYVQFERRFRGSPEAIKERQLDALRFVESIAGSTAPLLDLGCGRGEWLAALRDAGVLAYGVDLSSGMVADAQALGLDARCEDALVHLQGLEEGSLQGVSAFHFAEHVPLGLLTRILDAAFLALRPGGIILLETPNPTNVVVGSAAFYLDPTHLRPIHPDFMQFLVESRGFIDAEVHFVHPTVERAILHAGTPEQGYDPRLGRVVESAEWALFGPQDYVVVARRSGTPA